MMKIQSLVNWQKLMWILKDRYWSLCNRSFFGTSWHENNIVAASSTTCSCRIEIVQDTTRNATNPDPDKSAKSSVTPSTSSIASALEVNDRSKCWGQEKANRRVHLRLHVKNADHCNLEGSHTEAKPTTNLMVSSPQRPPVSIEMTTRRHRSPSTNSTYLVSLSFHALCQTAPFTAAIAHASRHWRRFARWHPLSVGLAILRPRSLSLGHRSLALWCSCRATSRFYETLPLLLDTLWQVSSPTVLAWSLPDLGHAARWRPRLSTDPPHSRLQVVMSRGRRSLFRITVRNTSGCILNSDFVGDAAQYLARSRSEWERRSYVGRIV